MSRNNSGRGEKNKEGVRGGKLREDGEKCAWLFRVLLCIVCALRAEGTGRGKRNIERVILCIQHLICVKV